MFSPLRLSRARTLLVISISAGWLVVAVALGGCSTNKEDQEFYERGWLWPRSMDRPDRAVTPGEKADAAAAARDPRPDW